ncbi:DUF4160 domain-containing protein [Lichenibacterium dinghuense]|uniref:DUF4160 domain-containing protein n=1 Tax=Lichenibacterium dinghuense TaxID=2895977 RepID=UPI001F166833|nr:DUF4160 domain-containing protein [Lichenibacterium sp. 6Y81]
MGKLHTLGRSEIWVFGRDHRPAHFHVLYPDGDTLVDIVSLAVLRGTLPRRHRQDVLAWAALNRSTLVAEWNRLNPDLPV